MPPSIVINAVILKINRLINEFIENIMRHNDFQTLEAAWRSIRFLLQHHQGQADIIIRILNLSARELEKDLHQASDIEYSQLFSKIYTEEFDQPGGTPYGLIIGNYAFSHQSNRDFSDPVSTLGAISQIAASCFVPFVASVGPELLGVETLAKLPTNLDKNFWQMEEYQRWHQLRKQQEARFIGLCLPKFLLRSPINSQYFASRQRFFSEQPSKPGHYLWGNAAFTYAANVVQSFIQTGWFNQSRGINQAIPPKALKLCNTHHFSGDDAQIKTRCELQLTSTQERKLSQAGLLPLYDHPKEQQAIFYHSQSLYQASNSEDAQMNSMLHYVMAASRFAHYIKIIIRDRIGCFANAQECQDYLSNWIRDYCASSHHISADARLRYPLSQAQISVQEKPQSPGKFLCKLDIQPHDQADNLQTKLRLTTHLSLKLQGKAS